MELGRQMGEAGRRLLPEIIRDAAEVAALAEDQALTVAVLPPSSPSPATPGAGGRPIHILLQPRPLILTGLPYKRDDTVREVSRSARTGADSRLTVTYLATDPRYPLPFGADRALLAWITTKAFQHGSVRFAAIADYLRTLGLDRGGTDYRRFRDRFQRIANLAIRIEETCCTDRQVRRLFLIPASHEPLSLSLDSTDSLRRELLTFDRYGFDLDPAFWQYLRDTRVPTPFDLLRRFHDAPQAWDFTQLVLFRCYSARSTSFVPWDELLDQLGATTTHPRRLKAHLNGVLDTVRSLYRDFPARFLPGLAGLEVRPWRMPMSE